MRRLAVLLLLTPAVLRADDAPLLLQKPTLNKTHVVFQFADDLWSVSRNGGSAQRLTSGAGIETDPIFSPDGSQVAFTGDYEGNVDVYVVPATGGIPKRLTYHPSTDRAVGWTPDGKRVLFQSGRDSHSRFTRLYTIGLDGGLPDELPLPMGDHGAFSADAKQLAYVPIRPAFRIWKRYRGGTTTPVWIAQLSDSRIEKIPRDNSNDFNPMWVNGRVLFLSDRAGPVTLFSYDPATKQVRQVHENKGLDIKSASAGPDAVVYEQFGSLHLFDPKNEKSTALEVRIDADLTTVRPKFVKASGQVRGGGISPSGVRAVFEARGDIFTVPAKKGQVRNLTETTGVAERDPAWSPDGKWIAYFSDESGEYQLHLRDQLGKSDVKKFALGKAPSFYFGPTWSPDSKKIAYSDKRLNLWILDIASGQSTLVATNTYAARMLTPAWSPDSRWLAYTRNLKNHLHAVFLYSLETSKSHRVTDGMSDARYVAFDHNGHYLYFTASTDVGPTLGGIEMSNMHLPVTRSVYVVVLSKERASPFAPESDDEKEGDTPKPMPMRSGEPMKKTTEVKIDLEDIDQRILTLPLPARNYVSLMSGKAGTLFVLELPSSAGGGRGALPGLVLHRFDLERRRSEKILEGVSGVEVSHDGDKLLYRQGERWVIGSAAAPGGLGDSTLRLDDVELKIEPRAEWRQMYDEVWRLERDFVYDPGHHGLDLKATASKYRPYLERLASRSDLNYLFGEMLGELSLGHVYVSGGDMPDVKRVPGGLLGADYKIDNGRYRFAKVYRGENWDPDLRAPLTQPGVNVKAGDYLLAVNGKNLKSSDNLYRAFEATAGKTVVLRVGADPDGKNARDVTVTPLESEATLRHRAWIEDNRRKVSELSQGRLAYVYLPDTSTGGYRSFNRYFFAQVDKDGAVIDERFNGGGKAADYFIARLGAPLLNMWTTREGEDYSTPAGAIFGPKAMIVNEQAGSGGDWLPWAFKRAKIGPVVGKRTWGGLVGIGGYPTLIDGGSVTAPHFAFWTPEGEWEVENRGVAPDVEVEFDPHLWRQGHDPQLEKAVALVLEELKKNPPTKPRRPAFPNYHKGKLESRR